MLPLETEDKVGILPILVSAMRKLYSKSIILHQRSKVICFCRVLSGFCFGLLYYRQVICIGFNLTPNNYSDNSRVFLPLSMWRGETVAPKTGGTKGVRRKDTTEIFTISHFKLNKKR